MSPREAEGARLMWKFAQELAMKPSKLRKQLMRATAIEAIAKYRKTEQGE